MRDELLKDFIKQAERYQFPAAATLKDLSRTGQGTVLQRASEIATVFDYVPDELREARFTPPNQKSFGYIPWSMQAFLSSMCILIEAAGSLVGRKFCDVGCGPGVKFICASLLGLKATGIEHHKGLVKLATENGLSKFCNSKRRIIRADALKCSYVSYDVVFVYSPFQNPELEDQLEKKIRDQLKVGSFIICPLDSRADADDRFRRLSSSYVFKKTVR